MQPASRKGSFNGSMEFGKGSEIDKEDINLNMNSMNSDMSVLESFIRDQIKENQNVPSPPIRVLAVGDDKQFNKLVS